ncbi:hypothetical protein BESB_051460 [Besnoitia besnoiti]|uniref:Uncharacterized protein n=1 Tax=Besnoitia besnoiti TaxID=94643 RepID=A0A2A9MBZ4_BESBE|nr:hypothetical protein BESB_051460 [Besnoitia besnoiti]PFH35495.1 hypothetical protein BESB_051460 [Besnoitia besnoiti]
MRFGRPSSQLLFAGALATVVAGPTAHGSESEQPPATPEVAADGAGAFQQPRLFSGFSPAALAQTLEETKHQFAPEVFQQIQLVLQQVESEDLASFLSLLRGDVSDPLGALLRDPRMVNQMRTAERVSKILESFAMHANVTEEKAKALEALLAKESALLATGQQSLESFERKLEDAEELLEEEVVVADEDL